MKLITPTTGQKKMLALLLGAGLSLSAAISGVFLTSPSEGLVNQSYIDPAGVVTTCHGHTGKQVVLGKTYTDTECMMFLIKDLNVADKQVLSVVKVPLSVYQRVALDDFVFNVGITNFKRSTMLKKFNAGDYKGGCEELSRWVYANGKKLKGLETRRDREMEFCLGDVRIEDE